MSYRVLTAALGTAALILLPACAPKPLLPATPTVAAASTITTPVPAKPALILALGTAALSAWLHHGGDNHLRALSADYATIVQAPYPISLSALRTACTTLAKDTAAARVYAPIPDAAAHREWTTVLASAARAASDCTQGIDQADAATVRSVGQDLGHAREAARRLSARLTTLGCACGFAPGLLDAM